MKRFWFAFRYNDWLSSSSVRAMTLQEEAVYLRLILTHYAMGYLPDNDETLRRLVGKECTLQDIRSVKHLFQRCQAIASDLLPVCLSTDEAKQSAIAMPSVLEEIKKSQTLSKIRSERGSEGGKQTQKRRKEANGKQLVEQTPSNCFNFAQANGEQEAKQNSTQSQSHSQSHNNVGGYPLVGVTTQEPQRIASRATEPPPGMPRSEQEAVDIGATAGIAPELCRLKYAEAESVGFVDWKGRPIRNFRSWLVVEKNAKVSREAEKKANPPKTSYHERPWRKGEAVPPKDQPPDKSNPLLWREWCDTHYSVGYAPGETKEEYRARTF